MQLTSTDLQPAETLHSDVASSPLQDEGKYGGLKLCGTPIRVNPRDRDGKLWLRNRRAFQGQRSVSLKRAEGARYPEINVFAHNTVDYLCEERALKGFIDRATQLRSQFPEMLDVEVAEIIRRAFLDDIEVYMALLAFTSANWAAGNTSTLAALPGGSGIKMGQANAREITDVATFLDILEDAAGGNRPNAVGMGKQVMRKYRRAVEWRDLGNTAVHRMYMTQDDCIELLKEHWDVETIHVLGAMGETANPGQTSSEADIWGDGLVAYFDTDANAMQQDGGSRVNPRTFAMVLEDLYDSSETEAGNIDLASWSWENDDPKGTYVAGALSWDGLILDNTQGGYLSDMI